MKHQGCVQHPIIIVDGPDGTGKSTLCAELETHGFKSMHLTYRWKDRMDLYHWSAMNWAIKQARRTPVVLDRWWPSEEVYAEVYRGGSKNLVFNQGLDRVATRFGFTYVIALPRIKKQYLEFFNELKNKREEMFGDMSQVYDAYHRLIDFGKLEMMSRRDVRRYDFNLYKEPSSFRKYVKVLISEATSRVYHRHPVLLETKFTSVSGNVTYPRGIVFIHHKGHKRHSIFAGAGRDGSELAGELKITSINHMWVNLATITQDEWLIVARIANENGIDPYLDVTRHDLPAISQMTVRDQLKHYMNLKEISA
jgi:hypothetical protein